MPAGNVSAGVPRAHTGDPLKPVLGKAGRTSQCYLHSYSLCVCFGFCVLINPLGRDGIAVVLSLGDLGRGCAERLGGGGMVRVLSQTFSIYGWYPQFRAHKEGGEISSSTAGGHASYRYPQDTSNPPTGEW